VSDFEQALRVVLADDHQLFREGLRGMLESEDMVVVGEAGDGAGAQALACELEPDVIVMDLQMGSSSGLEALARMRRANPEVRAVVLTVSAEQSDVLRALAAGARGYLLKDAPANQLALGIRQAAEGQVVLAGEVAGALTSHAQAGIQGIREGVALTARETEVLRLIAAGADNVAIGQELSISHHTVKRYVTNIFEKLGVGSRVQAAVHAVRVGLL
jgi:DNA-binding NarL/FixJ family response regulator